MKLSELTNPQIATLGVARLGGDARAIDTEDVAIEAYKIAPKRFCWRKYPDRIEIATVRFALSDAIKLTPPLLIGNNKDGWMLTLDGLKWVTSLPPELEGEEGVKQGSVLAIQDAERARLRRTNAFAKFHYNNRKTISLMDLYDFVRINEYFPERKRRERFVAIENAVLADPELKSVWLFLKRRFRKEIAPDEE